MLNRERIELPETVAFFQFHFEFFRLWDKRTLEKDIRNALSCHTNRKNPRVIRVVRTKIIHINSKHNVSRKENDFITKTSTLKNELKNKKYRGNNCQATSSSGQ